MRKIIYGVFLCLLISAGLGLVVTVAGCRGSGQGFLNRGIDALERGRIDEAVVLLRKAARVMPDSASAHCNLGIAYLKSGQIDLAVESLARSAELAPSEIIPLEFLGNAFIEQKRWDDARVTFEQAMERSYRSARLLTFLAVAELRAGEAIRARKLLTEALGADRDYLPAIYNMAVLYRDVAKNEPEAGKYFRRFLDVAKGPDRVDLPVDIDCVNAAETFLRPPQPVVVEVRDEKQEEPPVEVVVLPEVVDAVPEVSVADKVLALLVEAEQAIKKDEPVVALRKLRDAVAMDSDNPEPLWRLAVFYDKNLDHGRKAAEIYGDFKKKFPDDARAGLVVAPAGRVGPAVGASPGSSVPAVRAVEPSAGVTAHGMFEQGLKYHNDGDWTKAIDSYRKALSLDAGFYNAAYNLGLACKKAGRMDDAGKAFSQTVKIKPDFVQAHYMLALVYQETGRHEEAIGAGMRALEVQPDYAKVHYLLGVVYAMKNMPGPARGHFLNCIKAAQGDPLAERAREYLNRLPR